MLSSLIDHQRRSVRVVGGVDALIGRYPDRTAVCKLEERDGYRMRFVRGGQGCEGVILNTGGGVVAGDRVHHRIAASERADVTITTTAAERVYRSDGFPAQIRITLAVAAKAALAWLPQETILYSHARLDRAFDVDVATDASLLVAEVTVFGRKAMGEVLTHGEWTERWRVRRAGRLIFAENIGMHGDICNLLARKAIGAGADNIATMLFVATDAEIRLNAVREAIADASCAIGVSAWNGLLCVRAMGDDLAALRRSLALAVVALRGVAMPRVWQL
ncbi:MAG: urease accessory protein UreD [Hyphomicrobiales bacterium]|nr:urease accessory protein UreD [Hyphomicrobiales bacterium]